MRVTITDPGFAGRLEGTSAADTFMVLSAQGAVIDAGAGDDRITTGGGDDRITLGSGNDVAVTGGGDDRIIVNQFEGAKQIDGGPGNDTLTAGKSLASLHISAAGEHIVFRDANGNSLDTTNVNVFEFSDAVVYREGNESETDVARLYETILTRPADPARPTIWFDQLGAAGSFAGEAVESDLYARLPAEDEASLDEIDAAVSAQAQVVITGSMPIALPL